jgi:cytochrome oxidase Cu insertion factor (SCO1/SenC/PrrC family)
MPGMTTGIDPSDPTVVAAFRSALLHQLIAALVIFGIITLAWIAARDWHPPSAGISRELSPAEPAWRRVLRIGFGALWLFDGLLQVQPSMAVGLPSQVIQPGAASSPRWVQHLVNWGGTTWSFHPVQAGAAAVWIQVGIGLWLLFASRGTLSRLAGLAAAGWGLVVWVFGESFGGIFAPGLSWLTGAPGGVLFYVVAGLLLARPAGSWGGARLSRLLAAGTGAFLAGMAVLQAWPGRGFWQGSLHGQAGSLTSMVQTMAGTSQPAPLAALVTRFGGLVRAHGFAVNLTAVIALGVLGVAFMAAAAAGPGPWLAGRPGWLLRAAVAGLTVLCLATWVLVQDFGFFGGLGTDPNSMLPMLLLGVAAYLALARSPAVAPAPAAALAPADGTPDTKGYPDTSAAPDGTPGADKDPSGDEAGAPAPARRPAWLSPDSLRALARPSGALAAMAAASARTILSASAVGVIALGAIPMAAAQASPDASPILAESIDGAQAPLASAAPGFTLTDQHGHQVSLSRLRGKTVLLSFLDPVCLTDCPVEAQEFREAGIQLGSDDSKVELVAVNLNPVYNSTAYTQAFDREERLTGVRNWLFLTGSPAQLLSVWRRYGIAWVPQPAGAMIGHADVAFVIGPDGRLREEINFTPGPGTAATKSSFATELAIAARQAIAA